MLDLDGTLVDSFPAIAAALDRALGTMGRAPLGLPWVRVHVGRGLRRLVEDAVGDRDGAAVEELVRRFSEAYDELLEAATPALPGVDGALGLLAERCLLAVASNKPVRWSRRLVRHLGWSGWLPVVLGPEDAGAPKPDPRMVRLALGRLGTPADRALVVGDMEVDVETGRAAGVPVVAVSPDPSARGRLLEAGAAAAISGVADLPGWLDGRHGISFPAPPVRRDHGRT